MAIWRITMETVLDIEADSEEEAWDKLPEEISINDMYILDTEEVSPS